MSVRDVVSTETSVPESDVVEIRKYSNRRLYDTSASRYIKLTDVEEMIRQGQNIRVVDAQNGEDLTKSVMLQIICESKTQQDILPIGFLRQVIQASGKTVRNSLKEFLSLGFQAQRDLQQQVSQWMKAGASMNPFLGPLSSLFGNTTHAQNPPHQRNVSVRTATEPTVDTAPSMPERDHEKVAHVGSETSENHVQQEIEALRKQLAQLQKQIDRIGNNK